MNQYRKEKIQRFLDDEAMEMAVYDTLMEVFTRKNQSGDVNLLASERIAINLIQDAWKEMRRLQREKKQEQKELKQVGL